MCLLGGTAVVDLLALFGFGFGAALAPAHTPVFGAEFVIAGEYAADAEVASAGDCFLVVWTDSSGSSLDVRGRIYRTIDFEPEGPSFLIAGGPLDQHSPSVSSAPEGFFVVWTHTTEIDPIFDDPTEIRGGRVTSTGDLLNPEGILIRDNGPLGEDPQKPGTPVVAWNGEKWLAAWVEGSDPKVIARMIQDDGEVLTPTLEFGPSGYPRVAAAGSRFLLVYYSPDPDATVTSLIGPDLVVEGGSWLGQNTLGYAVGGNETDFLIAYECWWDLSDTRCVGAETGIRTFSVEVDGETGHVRDETRVPVSGLVDSTESHERRSAVAFAADRWVIAHHEVTASGVDTLADDTLVFVNTVHPEIAAQGTNGLIVAQADDGIVGRFFGFGATPGPSPTPSPMPSPTFSPSPTPTPRPDASPTNSAADAPGCGCTIQAKGSHDSIIATFVMAGLFSIAISQRRRRTVL